MRSAVSLVATLLLTSCLTPPSASQRVTDAARELNLATRFGRLDVAVGRTAPGSRELFLKRRTDWGKNVRVMDVTLAGLDMSDRDNATVVVDLAWMRMDEGTLRSTRVEQTWKNGDEGRGGWLLVGEKRLAGDFGLFGEAVTVLRPPSRGDVHFPSKTIR